MKTFAILDDADIVKAVNSAEQDYVDSLPDKKYWVETWTDANGDPAKAYNYASIGYKYFRKENAFASPSPYSSWVLDSSFNWQAPIPRPEDGKPYKWDEATTSWVEYVYV